MASIQPLDNIAHADIAVRTGHRAEWGDAINQIAVLPNEFAGVQRSAPILFRDSDDGLAAIAILGFERDSNLFLDEGRWVADYVPAMARTGPFRLGGGQDGTDPTVLIDMDDPRVAPIDAGSKDALPVFLEHGGNGPALESALAALRTVHVGMAQLAAMGDRFADAGIVEPAALTVTRASGQQVKFDGYQAIAPDKLAALSGEQLQRLNAAGLLGPAFHAAASLDNFNTLLALDARRSG